NSAIFAASLSTEITLCPISAKHAATTRPTYPAPTTAILTGWLSTTFSNKQVFPFPDIATPGTDMDESNFSCLRQSIQIDSTSSPREQSGPHRNPWPLHALPAD